MRKAQQVNEHMSVQGFSFLRLYDSKVSPHIAEYTGNLVGRNVVWLTPWRIRAVEEEPNHQLDRPMETPCAYEGMFGYQLVQQSRVCVPSNSATY